MLLKIYLNVTYKRLLLLQLFMCLTNKHFSELINQIEVEYRHLVP